MHPWSRRCYALRSRLVARVAKNGDARNIRGSRVAGRSHGHPQIAARSDIADLQGAVVSCARKVHRRQSGGKIARGGGRSIGECRVVAVFKSRSECRSVGAKSAEVENKRNTLIAGGIDDGADDRGIARVRSGRGNEGAT